MSEIARASNSLFAPPRVELISRADGSMVLRSRTALAPYARCVGEFLEHWADSQGERPPVLVDWLPWSHTFGGNFNISLVLRHGGTFYIDAGRPAPGLFDQSVANLREIQPTIYCNVPRAYDMLVTALSNDDALCRSFFERLQVLFYAAAALPQNVWDALQSLALKTLGETVPIVSSWGSTETGPLATDCHFQTDRSGVIGVPVPGGVPPTLRRPSRGRTN